MQSIPETYYEAAKLDGAGPARQFFHITLPMLRDVLVVAAVFQLITLLKFFDAVWVMENEMPGNDDSIVVNVIGPGHLIGEMGVLDGSPRSATCTA